jgi:ABC-type transport system involved in multi-copper enzyme maturation permease subunit
MMRAEFTKFRTTPGWVLTTAGAVLLVVLLGVFYAFGTNQSCSNGPVEVPCPVPPNGPEGGAVRDEFSFAHQPLTGDGEITAHLASMTGILTYPPPHHDSLVPGLAPWSKAGIMVKDGIKPGSAYASVLLTGAHGLRLQHDYTHDQAGPPSARWLRLTRTGDRLTGYASTDGAAWTPIGTVRLAGLPDTVQIGLFVTSPSDITTEESPHGGTMVQARFTQTTAVFDHLSRGGGWTYDRVGDDGNRTDWERFHRAAGMRQSGGALTVTGSGDVAPAESAAGPPVETTLSGLPIALLMVIVVAVLFVTAEYRRGLIRTTLLATPRRERAAAAKAAVIGAVMLAAGLAAAVITVPIVLRLLHSRGVYVLPAPGLTAVRLIVGTGLLVSLTAMFAYALGLLLRRGLAAIAVAALLVVAPYLLATTSVLPAQAARWLLRLTPAAGFAIQQTIPAYAQLLLPYDPSGGYFPLAGWAGLGVLAAWAALALGLATWRLRRDDA